MYRESQDGCPYLAGVRDAVAVVADLCWWWVDRDDCHVLTWRESWGWLDQGRSVSKGWAQAPLLGQDLLVRHGINGVREAECWTAAKEGGKMRRSYFKQYLSHLPETDSSLASWMLQGTGCDVPARCLQSRDNPDSLLYFKDRICLVYASANLWIILTHVSDWL